MDMHLLSGFSNPVRTSYGRSFLQTYWEVIKSTFVSISEINKGCRDEGKGGLAGSTETPAVITKRKNNFHMHFRV